MKFLTDKFFSNTSRFEILLLTIPFVCWFFCFFNFFTGHLYLEADAISYADHIGFYTDNLSKGIFPLWDPAWFSGVPYHFFLRRIGDVNPLLFLIVLLKWIGIPSATAYLIFLALYYFLAAWAFYLIARFLLVDRFFAFTAYILFLFSSWGSEVFYNYIIIIFVPIIWFFYFLLCFARSTFEDSKVAKLSRTAQKGFFLGICLCVGIIVTTYIPFFFLTILTIFSFLYLLFYGNHFLDFLKRSFTFFNKNKIFTVFCIIFILSACIPALVFYKESKSGEFVLPDRHSGANVSSAVAVGLASAASGDIISHGYFDRVFDDHAHIDMGDIYVPYLFFLILLSTACGRVNKLIFFLLFNILGLSLITITSAAGVHRFLFDHIIFFKFIRNIYYFFWLAMLPMAILLSVCTFKSLLTAISNSSKKTAWLVYIIICHLIFILFLCGHQGVLWGAWAAIFISMLYFLIYFYCENKISYPAGFCLLLLAVFVQSAEVYGFLDNKLFQAQREAVQYEQTHQNPKKMKMSLYYASGWFEILINYIDPQVLDDYRSHQFIFYDNVIPYQDSPEFFKTLQLQKTMAGNVNVAFLSNSESGPGDWRSNPDTGAQADVNPITSGELSVLRSDANTWDLKARLSNSRFLVINDNYNSDWHAFINGRQSRLLRANVAFKGLWIPSGESNIVLRFSSPKRYMFHFSLIALFAGTFLYLLVLLKNGRRPESYV